MNLIWVTNTRPSTLVIPGLVDYAGQPLRFTGPGTPLARRCVRAEALGNELLQRYIRSGMLVVGDAGQVAVAPPAVRAPAPVPAPAPVAVAPAPVVEPEPVPEPVPEPAVEASEPEVAADEADTSTETPQASSGGGGKKKKRY